MKNKILLFIFVLPFICSSAATWKQPTKPQVIITDFKANKQMEVTIPLFVDSKMSGNKACIFVDPKHKFDEFIGFGGAITDAVAETFAKLPKNKQDEIIKAYFDPSSGIGYRVIRTNMNSCDFSSESYSYVIENDTMLNSFDIAHDRKYKLPLIKRVYETIGENFMLYVSPWSPPAWMKTNNNMLKGGELKKECYQPWANYFVKYIQSYQNAGIPVWGLTIQNEPQAIQKWESCVFDPDMAHNFIDNFLGPTLKRNGMANKKIIAGDHNRDFVYHYVADMLNDQKTSKFIWGVGFHWYDRGKYENIDQIRNSFPNKKLVFTEGCVEWFNPDKIHGVEIGEYYATNIINDLNRGVVLWTDWNILLDEKGGPNHVGNVCFAPIHGVISTGELIYTSGYAYIGHFSKYIRPGARRITASSNKMQLETTSFINPDGKIIVVVLNRTNDIVPYSVFVSGKEAKSICNPHTIATWIF